MAAHNLELHHAAPRCLLRLHDEATRSPFDGAGIEAWLSWEEEAMRWSVPVEISREDLAELVEASTVALERKEHRRLHESDFARWGRRGGVETLRRYGTCWFAALALRRWDKISPAALEAARPIRCGSGRGVRIIGPRVSWYPPAAHDREEDGGKSKGLRALEAAEEDSAASRGHRGGP